VLKSANGFSYKVNKRVKKIDYFMIQTDLKEHYLSIGEGEVEGNFLKKVWFLIKDELIGDVHCEIKNAQDQPIESECR